MPPTNHSAAIQESWPTKIGHVQTWPTKVGQRKKLANIYDTRQTFVAQLGFTLCTKLTGAVYCNRSCVFATGGGRAVWVLPRKLEIACIDPHQSGFVGKGSDNLQLIKFWPSRTPR